MRLDHLLSKEFLLLHWLLPQLWVVGVAVIVVHAPYVGVWVAADYFLFCGCASFFTLGWVCIK